MTLVRAPAGEIEGRERTGARVFLGIPYGAPPIGRLRFRPPVAAAPLGHLDATQPGAAPPQLLRPRPDWAPIGREEYFGEDCLNLDLYAPPDTKELRPVIVHAFGGGFEGGSAGRASIDGAAFAARTGCILVRPNMRTGALGFLHLAEAFPELAETNRGMLDLLLALDWVQENARAFGGDLNRVTLVGMSSGAFTSAALFGARRDPLPFSRAWLMSGAASRIVEPETATAIARRFLDEVEVSPGDVTALETLPLEAILAAQSRILSTDLAERNAPGGRTLGIVRDGRSLPLHPIEALERGAGRGVALVLGHTEQEARMWYALGATGDPDEARLRETVRRFDGDVAGDSLARFRKERPGASLRDLEEAFLTERIYRGPALATAEAQRLGGGHAWTYAFDWHPAGEHASLGAAHGFDEPFVFGASSETAPLLHGDSGAEDLAARMEGALVSLAETGSPGWHGHDRFGTDRK